MNKRFFTIVAIVITLFPALVWARIPAAHPDKMRLRWYGVRIEPLPDISPKAIISCHNQANRTGLIAQAGVLAPANLEMFPGPTVGASFEICLERYSFINWAPSRAGFDLFFGTHLSTDKLFMNLNLGTRYQFPIMEKFDLGFYFKYQFMPNFSKFNDDHHGLFFGLLGEVRPMYSATEERPLGGLFFTARTGVGANSYTQTNQTRVVVEFMLSAGWRLADF